MKIVFNLIFLLASIAANAQTPVLPSTSNERYIEVKTSDTLIVDPDLILFSIILDKQATNANMFELENEEAEAKDKERDLAQKRRQVEEVLRKNNATFKFIDKKEGKNLFTKDLGTEGNSYKVELKSLAQLEKVKSDLAIVRAVTSKVTNVYVDNKEKFELILIDKVMEKAAREATEIAKSMGVTLDKPLNVSNQTPDDMYSSMFSNPESMGGMGALFSMMGNMFKSETEQLSKVTISKKLLVRYGIK
jgi:uncharacterized protein YggE